MRQPLDNKPATTDCLTISPEVRGSRPMTIVRATTYVPKACAKRVNNVGVSDSPMTPRTPEMLILRVGIGRMKYGVRRLVAALKIDLGVKSGDKAPHSKVSLVQSVAHPIK